MSIGHYFVVTIALVLGTRATAAQWWYVTHSSDGAVYFFDTQSTKQSQKDVVFWVHRYERASTAGVASVKTQQVATCATRALQTLQAIDYDKAGKVLAVTSRFGPGSEVAPDTVGETIFLFACGVSDVRRSIGFEISTTPAEFAANVWSNWKLWSNYRRRSLQPG